MANFGFNTAEYDPNVDSGGSYDPIPEGEYQLMCEEAEQRQTKAGTGYYIRAKFRVLGPTNANRVIFMNFNTHNPSSKAEEIGRRQLAGWAQACGNPNASDSDQLVNVPSARMLVLKKVRVTTVLKTSLPASKPQTAQAALLRRQRLPPLLQSRLLQLLKPPLVKKPLGMIDEVSGLRGTK